MLEVRALAGDQTSQSGPAGEWGQKEVRYLSVPWGHQKCPSWIWDFSQSQIQFFHGRVVAGLEDPLLTTLVFTRAL